jgi:hypothetical protein
LPLPPLPSLLLLSFVVLGFFFDPLGARVHGM